MKKDHSRRLLAGGLALALLTGLPAWGEPAEHIAYVATDGSDASGDGTPVASLRQK